MIYGISKYKKIPKVVLENKQTNKQKRKEWNELNWKVI